MPNALRAWRWRVFASTWLCYAGIYFCRKPFSIVKSQLGSELSFSAQQLAWAYSAYLVAYTVGQFLSGALGPRFGPRAMLLGSMGIAAVTGVGMGFGHQLAWFVVLMSLNGLAQGVAWSNAVGNMGAWFHKEERGTVMGVWTTNFQFGGIAANTMAAWLLAHYGFRYAFFGGAMVLLAIMVFFWFNQANCPEDKGLPKVSDEAPEVKAGPVTPMGDSTWVTVLLIGMAYFGMKFIRYALWSWAPFVLSRNFQLKGDDAGYLSTVFDVCGMAGVVFLGWASDKLFSGRRALASFVMILALVGATAAMVTVGSNNLMVFAVCMGLIGFTLYGPDAIMTSAGVMDVAKSHTVRAAGVIGGLGAAGSVLQEVLIGNSGAELGPILGMLLASAVLTALCLLAILVQRRLAGSKEKT